MTDDPKGGDPILEQRPLTRRQRLFVEFYLQTWNASEAARLAGYTSKPNMQGPRLMAKDSIKARIEQRLKEVSMPADEVLVRLTQQARNESADYIGVDGTVNMRRLIEDGKQHLIKGTKFDRRGNLIVEFYDSQTALSLLGKHLGLFTEHLDITTAGEKLNSGPAEDEHLRALSALAAAFRDLLPADSEGPESSLDTPEQAPGAGAPVEGV